MSPEQPLIALKEWAVTVQALVQGRRILLLRNGGIWGPGGDFRVDHSEFLLFPTYEHQREDLLKDGYRSTLRDLLAPLARGENHLFPLGQGRSSHRVVPTGKGRCAVAPSHLDQRLRRVPAPLEAETALAVMLLRVYRMEQPVSVPALPEYLGCTSWVEILDQVPLDGLRLVLSDWEFGRRVDEIKGYLNRVAGGAASGGYGET